MTQIRLKRILCPTDFSAPSVHALTYACGIAEQFQADLHILHVLQDFAFPMLTEPTAVYGLPADFNEKIRASAELALAKLPAPTRIGSADVCRILRHGTPFAEILEYAREQDVDLIVLGTEGRTGLRHALLGSVAEKVVRTAPCPVLTVRPPDFA